MALISDVPEQTFRDYTKMDGVLPSWAWVGLRLITFAVVLAEVYLLIVDAGLGLTLFWKIIIPSLPFVFVLMPGLWRQVCPMALVNQIPREWKFQSNRTLPLSLKNLAYLISALVFFFVVSLRHVFFNQSATGVLVLIIGALTAAFIGGILFKGRSGWCGTFCPLAPIQKAYGHSPAVVIKNGYCEPCVGCQKNCYDFNPRAAIHADLSDPDPWYAGHKRFFVAALPGFAWGFFTVTDQTVANLGNYYLELGGWMLISLGIYMALTGLVRISQYKAAAIFGMGALLIFYWFAAPLIVSTAGDLLGVTFPPWGWMVPYAIIITAASWSIFTGFQYESQYEEFTKPPRDIQVSVDGSAAAALGGAGGGLVTERSSGQHFDANPGKTILESLEAAGLPIDFGCRMGMCGADPVGIFDGHDNLNESSDDELSTLRRLGLEGRARLACMCRPTGGDIAIDIKEMPVDAIGLEDDGDRPDLGAESGVGRVIVVGNGAAGLTAADVLRQNSPTCRIDVIAKEPHHFYNRMGIGRLVYAEDEEIEKLSLMPIDWYERKEVNVILGTGVEDIDRSNKTVSLTSGENLPYDKLILAVGGIAPSLPCEGSDLPGCFVLHHADDAINIRTWKNEQGARAAAVLGGGVLGVEAADALRQLGLRVTLLHRGKGLMDRQLDVKGSAILEYFVEGLGMDVRTGTSIAKVVGNGKVESIELDDGKSLPVEIVMSCIGIRPNLELAQKAELETNRGILVDSQMRTSDPDIFAVGDVAEAKSGPAGLWPVSTGQAQVAAMAAFGQEENYEPPRAVVKLKMDSIDVKAYGLTEPKSDAQEVLLDPNEPENEHRKLIVENGLIVGAVFVGPPGTANFLAEAIQAGGDVSAVLDDLRAGKWDALERVGSPV